MLWSPARALPRRWENPSEHTQVLFLCCPFSLCSPSCASSWCAALISPPVPFPPQLCQAKGFICEFCQNEDDIIFPFELHKCRTCEGEGWCQVWSGRTRLNTKLIYFPSAVLIRKSLVWFSTSLCFTTGMLSSWHEKGLWQDLLPAADNTDCSLLSHLPTLTECKACYHKTCFKSGSCPRCERLQARRELLAKQSLESYMSDYEEEPTEALALEATVPETTWRGHIQPSS